MPYSEATNKPSLSTRRRLFVLCDGTWQDSVSNTRPLTNVATLARCLEGVADDGCLQISYYDQGVGNGTSRLARVMDGATGRGISAKIREAYSFLSYNLEHESDEIILVGFSRGAFTVQCLASFISQVGLLRRRHLYYLPGLFTLWANQHRHSTQDILAKHVSMFSTENLLTANVQIKACVVWDTVSSLGTLTPWNRPYSFVGSVIPKAVENAFQALALDETRGQFQPCIWETKESSETHAKQCWFLGSHSDVGGTGDAALGAVTLVWVVRQLTEICKVKFNQEEVMRHLRHRFLEWDVECGLFGQIRQNSTLSQRSSSGHMTKSSPLWWILGRIVRRLDMGPAHHDPGLDIEVTIHCTVRLSMTQDPTICRRVKKWHTTKLNDDDDVVYWTHDKKKLAEEEIGGRDGYEYNLLKTWSTGNLLELETDRSRFALIVDAMVHDPREESTGHGQFSSLLQKTLTFEDYCLAPDFMYKGACAKRRTLTALKDTFMDCVKLRGRWSPQQPC